ncbi:NACHT, LRR and PYD domains-containing protein 1 homolog [Alosa pseudoharengus]|uniref:NACHT, LRR and PYD domains-containing protein 1 homolog n=1 Tax=Alosa pseudoharengus TaxID=34774 RepID=UPI003F8CDB97
MAQKSISNIQGCLRFSRQTTKRKASSEKKTSDASPTSTLKQQESSGDVHQKRQRREQYYNVGKPSPTGSFLESQTHTRGFPKSRCELCTHVSDSSSWDPVDPEVSTGEDGSVTFYLSSASGRYQCSRSGVRWVCAGEVSLQYRYVSWGQFREDLAESCYKPAGPLVDIKVFSGKLDEVHLPHNMCIGDSEKDVKHAMKILHGQEGKVSLETCEVGQFHAKYLSPSFSPVGPVMIGKSEQAVLVHCKLLHYRPSATSLIQRTYLIPEDRDLEDKVSCQEDKCNSIQILLPDPVRPLQLGDSYSLITTPRSTVTPQDMILRGYDATPNFYKIAVKMVKFPLTMKLTHNKKNKKCVWTQRIQEDDFCKTTALTNKKNVVEAAQFVDTHKIEVIDGGCLVRPIVDAMQSYNLINDEKVSIIMAENTNENKMRCVYEFLRSVGPKGKAKFYEILQKHEPQLVDSLNDPY